MGDDVDIERATVVEAVGRESGLSINQQKKKHWVNVLLFVSRFKRVLSSTIKNTESNVGVCARANVG